MVAGTDLHDLSCVAHVHSTYSDGTATVPEILAAARANAVDVVLLTDHDSLAARRDGWERWHDGVLLLVGHEVSPRGGHFLAFGLDEEIDHDGASEQDVCARVRAGGGFGFAAHPFSEGSRMSTLIGRAHPWRSIEDCPGAGIELWSLVTDAAEAWRTPREAVAFLRDPRRVIAGPPAGHLRRWDALCQHNKVPALGGLDAHQTGFRFRDRAFSPMSHERYFGYLHTHVLCERAPRGELAPDREQVYAALREGRSYLALDVFHPAHGFRYWAERDGETVPMGAEREAGGWTLHARAPRAARLRVLRDGRVVAAADSTEIEHAALTAGVYRVEARIEAGSVERTWIVSNPIYLRKRA